MKRALNCNQFAICALREVWCVRVISQQRVVNRMVLVASEHRSTLQVPFPAALAVWILAYSSPRTSLGGDPAFATLFRVLRVVLRVLVTL